MVTKNKKISPEDMKTSEIIDEMYEDYPSDKFEELEDELIKRYPFSYYFKVKFEEIEEQIKELTKLLRHDHKDGEIVIKL